ncbi:ubiquitin-like protein 3b isoform X2 [Larimichthys crocea]|uniref:ubiquitin-like protein 3b isoform X2 n=1 Tax=Larimichthys crocea TaxID=215358 RepID=UPI000F5F96EE|nr:uncharacterized protein LOC104925552 isoform X2 [Larimichthys crocea]
MTRPQTSPSMCLRTGLQDGRRRGEHSQHTAPYLPGRFLHGNVTLGALKLPRAERPSCTWLPERLFQSPTLMVKGTEKKPQRATAVSSCKQQKRHPYPLT